LSFCAAAELAENNLPAARALIAEAVQISDESGEVWWLPEILRVRGHIMLEEADGAGAAEADFHSSLALAREQGAKVWQLRTSISLARLWQGQGKRKEALDLVAAIYNQFTEGYDIADMMDAKALLEELK
jgi:predicted ATPase